MKRKVIEYVAFFFLTSQKAKVQHQKLVGMLLSLSLDMPKWKWNIIYMNFVVVLPKLIKIYSIWVIIDKLTKSAHFLLVKATYNVAKLA